ncbi:hypothetical protein Q7567_07945 [Acinetobacter baumannii]|jgi:hypothetical protein|uniref:Uncharacterized protein n=1 Tax=Acinetobacter nosocomialis TaxID=106654 RepID=A0A3G6YV07_ACINO|nr:MULTISPECIES: hypothetical protein [Acinetobacter]EKU1747990.1 hypothetical protein [Acinetobacter baumannii]AZC02013.1 hypothetical protein DKC18_004625 [Acinetobacter nosocomialis]AZC04060.1 hypothetical protein DKE50_004710 [Acinetobacter nosocomialis]AZC05789.1 hypothetical protein DKE44_004685 [Acinetobacter nosocomialis]EKU60816.1 hypothetical protein ACINWC487_2959 [Acinetobacter nosocomialis]
MGIKKLVTITVEAQIEIELPEEFKELSQQDIDGIKACGYEDFKIQDDLYKYAAELVLNGGENGNWDVFGYVVADWKKGMTGIPANSTFFNRQDLHITDCEVEEIK